MQDFAVILIGLNILIIVIQYGVSSILKWVHPNAGKITKDYSYQPTVSILLPCFNEGAHVYETIKSIRKSNYPMEKLDIIAVDDCSTDDSFSYMEKARDDFPHVQIHKNEYNKGKHKTILHASDFTSAEIVLCIDSDTIFASDTVSELMACFAESNIGAVGGAVGIINVNDSILTSFQAAMYYMSFNLGKVPENYYRTVGCISGCLFAIKRDLLVKLEPLLSHRHWFGVPISEGEDRFLTHQVNLHGYSTYVNLDAHCWTHVPVKLSQYFKQQLRWRRSSMRDLLLTIRTLPRHMKLHPYALYVYLILPLTTISALIAMACSAAMNPLFWISSPAIMMYTIIALLSSIAIKKHNPEQTIKNPIKLVIFGAWWFINSMFLTMLSLCTLHSGEWGTREKPQKEVA